MSDEPLLVRGKQTGYLWTWWRGDLVTPMLPLAGWHVEMPQDRLLLMRSCNLDRREVEARLSRGHRAYYGYVDRELVAFGWSAIHEASFGSPQVSFWVPPQNLYLYHFLTQFHRRGQGFYPRLLQEIVQRESERCERFWIIHQQANVSSRRGIAKAGFSIATAIHHTPDQLRLVLAAGEDSARALAGSELLGLPLVE